MSDDRRAIKAGLRRLRLPESYWDAKLEQMWHLAEPVKCALCYFRPNERMYTLPFTPNRRTR